MTSIQTRSIVLLLKHLHPSFSPCGIEAARQKECEAVLSGTNGVYARHYSCFMTTGHKRTVVFCDTHFVFPLGGLFSAFNRVEECRSLAAQLNFAVPNGQS